MALIKYIKQPLSMSLGQYTDAELRKIESSISGSVQFAEELEAIVAAQAATISTLQAAITALQAESYTVSALKSADQSVTSDATINADPDLVITLNAAGIWDIEGAVAAICSAGAINLSYDLEFTGTIQSPGTALSGVPSTSNIARVYDSAVPHTPGAASTASLTANNQRNLSMKGIIKVLTPGNLVFWWAQGASSATAVTLRQGSFIRARKIA